LPVKCCIICNIWISIYISRSSLLTWLTNAEYHWYAYESISNKKWVPRFQVSCSEHCDLVNTRYRQSAGHYVIASALLMPTLRCAFLRSLLGFPEACHFVSEKLLLSEVAKCGACCDECCMAETARWDGGVEWSDPIIEQPSARGHRHFYCENVSPRDGLRDPHPTPSKTAGYFQMSEKRKILKWSLLLIAGLKYY
jgi:hypothetical protein